MYQEMENIFLVVVFLVCGAGYVSADGKYWWMNSGAFNNGGAGNNIQNNNNHKEKFFKTKISQKRL